jgi:hypothetical protein
MTAVHQNTRVYKYLARDATHTPHIPPPYCGGEREAPIDPTVSHVFDQPRIGGKYESDDDKESCVSSALDLRTAQPRRSHSVCA